MVWYLLRDLLRRNWQIHSAMSSIAAFLWIPVTLGDLDLHWCLAGALMMAVTIGPMTSVSTIGLREIRILPIAFGDLWTLSWLASTVVSSAIVLVASAAGLGVALLFGGTTRVRSDMLLLVTLYCFIYTSMVLVLMPAMNFVSRRRRPGRVTTMLTVALLLCFFGSLGLPFVISSHLPLSFAQLSPALIGVLLAGVLASFAILAWRPATGILTAAPAAASSRPSKRRRDFWPSDRLTGISRVLVPYLLTTAVVTLLVAAGSAWYVSRFGGTIADALGESASSMAYMFIGMTSPWMPWARLLKSLPLSARFSTALLTITSLAAWVTIAVTLILLVPVFGVTLPPWFTLVVVAWYGGMSALVNALAFRNQGSIWWVIIPAAGSGPLVRALARDMLSPDSLWLLLAALVAVAGAAWINHRTLTRCGSSSRAFRKQAMAPFGISGPVAQR